MFCAFSFEVSFPWAQGWELFLNDDCSFHFFPSQYRYRNCCCQRHLYNKRRSKDVSGLGFISLQIYLGLSLVSFESCFWKPFLRRQVPTSQITSSLYVLGQLQGVCVLLDMPVQLQGILATFGMFMQRQEFVSGCCVIVQHLFLEQCWTWHQQKDRNRMRKRRTPALWCCTHRLTLTSFRGPLLPGAYSVFHKECVQPASHTHWM